MLHEWKVSNHLIMLKREEENKAEQSRSFAIAYTGKCDAGVVGEAFRRGSAIKVARSMLHIVILSK